MTPYFKRNGVTIFVGDSREVLRGLSDESVHCCVTSPPYWGLRDYGTATWEGGDSECDHVNNGENQSRWAREGSGLSGSKQDGAAVFAKYGYRNTCGKCGATRIDSQLGLEKTPEEYVDSMVSLFREVRRVLRDDGTLWLNLGDSYNNAGSSKNGTGLDGKQRGGATGANGECGYKKRDLRHSLKSSGIKIKDLIGIPWRVAFALQSDGWYLRDAIIWAKPNGMPGSQQDRCTSSYETIFMLSKSQRYWSDFDAIKTPPREASLIRTAQDIQSQAGSHRANAGGKTNGTMKAVGVRSDKQRGHSRQHAGFNERWDAMDKAEQQSQPATMRNVWFVAPAQTKDNHFAVMPKDIARRCICAGCPEGGIVLDPFLGSGTTAAVAKKCGCKCVGIELNPEYAELASKRLRQGSLIQ